jgi:tight adherence protein C
MIARWALIAGGALFFVGVATIVVALAAASFGRIGVARGLSAIDKVYGAGVGDPFGSRSLSPMANRMTTFSRSITPAGAVDRLRRKLDHAGNPDYWTVERIFELKGLGLIGFLIGGALLGFLVGPVGAVVGALVGAVIGFYAPDVVVYDVGERRQNALRRTLPDILDTLTVSVEAGLGFDAALVQVTKHGMGPVAGEFSRMLQEMQIGRSRVDALRGVAQRTKVPELRNFCAIVAQASELGLPIASVLREQAREMRVRRRQHAEEVAQKIPVKIMFPVVFCIFPSLFIVILGPGVLNLINTLFH